MPNLNLKDDEVVHEEPMTPRLRRQDEGAQHSSMVTVLYIVLILVIAGAGVYLLNNYGIIKLWGSKPAVKRVAVPPPVDTTAMAAKDTVMPESPIADLKKATPVKPGKSELRKGTGVKAPAPKRELAPVQPAGSGEFAVQISSWPVEEKANAHALQLREGGLDAYVVRTGERWNVRVGRYASEQEARTVAARLGENAESRVIVVRAQ